MTAAEVRDWIACPQLYHLRRDRPQPTTWSAAELVRRRAVVGLAESWSTEVVPDAVVRGTADIRWSADVPQHHAAMALGRQVMLRLQETLDHRDAHLSGYRDEQCRAIEVVDRHLTWWLIDVGRRPLASAWIEAAMLAELRPECTHVAVVTVELRRWPTVPRITVHEPRPVAPIADQVEIMDRAAAGALVSDPRRIPRTPGLHCSRCPDKQCPVRA